MYFSTPNSLSPLVKFAIALTILAATANAQQSANHHGLFTRRIDIGPRTGAPSSAGPKVQSNVIAKSKVSENQDHISYTAVPIGVLPGKTNTVVAELANVLNNLGHVAGFSFVYTGDEQDYYLTAQAFIWRDGQLKALPLLAGWPGVFATGINDRDQVIGEANNFDSAGNRLRTAVLWDGGKVINLGTLDTNSNSAAFGINVWGTAVGSNKNLVDGLTTPVVWYAKAIHPLPLLPGEAGGIAFGINDLGVIAGYQFQEGDVSEIPCLWYWNGTGYTAMSLGSFGGDYGEANDVNNLGHAVGYSLYAGDLHGPAFVWDRRGLHPLPMLAGDTDGYALAINDGGQVVGFSELVDDFGDLLSQRVVIWQHGTVTDLQTVVPSDTPTLTDLGNVNLSGQIPVVTGFFDDGSLASYVLIPRDR
ncbi:MAG TPA: hypothetical protein VEI01_12390 [Terriglobales bacterium]|nr:hypothetical protein [Terriglobales bacterium]